jgi:hypothetical protein
MKSLRPERAHGFAAEFVSNGFNATRAVIACGITNKPTSAQVIGHRLLCNVITREAIEKHMQDAKMDANEVLERLSKIARTEVEFKGSDVVKANELIGKGHGIFVDKLETTNTSESKALTDSIELKITQISSNLSISQENAAIQFFSSLSDFGSDHAKPENFGKYRPIIENYLAKPQEQPIIEAGDQ